MSLVHNGACVLRLIGNGSDRSLQDVALSSGHAGCYPCLDRDRLPAPVHRALTASPIRPQVLQQRLDSSEPLIDLSHLWIDLLLQGLLDKERCKRCRQQSEQPDA